MPLKDVAALIIVIEDAVNRLRVVDPDGNLVELVSRADRVRAFARSDDSVVVALKSQGRHRVDDSSGFGRLSSVR